jgi:plasmid stability protein
MTQAIWGNVDRQVIERLKLRAQRNGRSLDEEIKVILEEVAAAEGRDEENSHRTQRAENQERLRRVRAEYFPNFAESSLGDSSTQGLQPLSRTADPINILDVVEAFNLLRQSIRWNDAPIRDLIDEGRRF